MVRLQKATQCALYAVLELARDPKRQLSAAEIAAHYELSANHLAKVLQVLTRARLVESVRGVGGGYRFIGNPKRVTLYEIIRLFEDVGQDGEGRRGGAAGAGASDEITDALDRVMAEIEDIAVATLKSITLATLLNVIVKRGARTSASEPATLLAGNAAD